MFNVNEKTARQDKVMLTPVPISAYFPTSLVVLFSNL
jgi:hypothetical protein